MRVMAQGHGDPANGFSAGRDKANGIKIQHIRPEFCHKPPFPRRNPDFHIFRCFPRGDGAKVMVGKTSFVAGRYYTGNPNMLAGGLERV